MRNRMRDNFIAAAAPVMQTLERAGYEAYLVGGCVREALRGEMAYETDIDITTNALPEEIRRVFAHMTVIETGIKHGTVTVLQPIHHRSPEAVGEAEKNRAAAASVSRIPIEITTYRVDGDYSDGRHPDQVRFVTSLQQDLARRDFTVNAMAMDLRGEIMDPFGGQEDLKAGIIRAVGDPDTRFREDALRILRALRFAAVLTVPGASSIASLPEPAADTAEAAPAADTTQPEPANGTPASPPADAAAFRIEARTGEALFRCAPLLQRISAERIFAELKKLVCGPGAGEVVRAYADILSVVIPELAPMKGFVQHNPYHNYDVLEHCIRAMEAVGAVAPVDGETGTGDNSPASPAQMKLAALLHDIGKPSTFTRDENGIGHFYGHPQAGAEIVRRILRRLKADRFTIERISILVKYHDLVFQEDDRLLKRWMNRYTPQVLLEILELKRADNIATGNVSRELLDKFRRIETRIRSIKEERDKGQTCFCVKDLAISGKDLLEAGIPEGPRIGELLQTLLDAVIEGEIQNERGELMKAALKK